MRRRNREQINLIKFNHKIEYKNNRISRKKL